MAINRCDFSYEDSLRSCEEYTADLDEGSMSSPILVPHCVNALILPGLYVSQNLAKQIPTGIIAEIP